MSRIAGNGDRVLSEPVGLDGSEQCASSIQRLHPVVDLMDSQREVTDLGGTMRLGLYPAQLAEGSSVAQLYGRSSRL